MLSALLLVNTKGDVLVSKYYRKEAKTNISDLFRINVISSQNPLPITTIDNQTFYHLKHENIYVVAVSSDNPNTCMVFEFLDKIIKLGIRYCHKFDELAIKNNFILIYELFDGSLRLN
jgi:AP-2 complex subunit mu-1